VFICNRPLSGVLAALAAAAMFVAVDELHERHSERMAAAAEAPARGADVADPWLTDATRRALAISKAPANCRNCDQKGAGIEQINRCKTVIQARSSLHGICAL
jgi:hypothetical protein